MHSFPSLTRRSVAVRFVSFLTGVLILAFTSVSRAAERVALFDGFSLSGWEGNSSVWRVEDGAIVGGSMQGNPRNEFLTTTRSYRNFILRLEFKLVGTEGFINGGVQFRSRRITEPDHEMIGYQADIGAGYTGSLYDESRRKRFLAEASKPLVSQTEKPGDWNRYEIRCEGPRVVLMLNGRVTVDYTEREPGLESEGLIGLQIHGGCKAEIAFRDITVEELSGTLVPPEGEIVKRLVVEPGRILPTATTPSTTFALQAGEIIVTLGQGILDRDARAGGIESALAATFAALRPRFRPMAWEGDTVYQQWREANFGSLHAQLTATGATLVLAQFGQMEAFDGPERIEEFTAAYAQLLAQVPASARRRGAFAAADRASNRRGSRYRRRSIRPCSSTPTPRDAWLSSAVHSTSTCSPRSSQSRTWAPALPRTGCISPPRAPHESPGSWLARWARTVWRRTRMSRHCRRRSRRRIESGSSAGVRRTGRLRTAIAPRRRSENRLQRSLRSRKSLLVTVRCSRRKTHVSTIWLRIRARLRRPEPMLSRRRISEWLKALVRFRRRRR